MIENTSRVKACRLAALHTSNKKRINVASEIRPSLLELSRIEQILHS